MSLPDDRSRSSAQIGIALLVCGLSMQLQTAPLQAQEARERGSISFGAFLTDRRTSTRLDSDQGTGTDLDLETDLGLDTSSTVARLSGHYWMTRRQRLDLSVFDLSRSSSKALEETIEYGDEIFDIDTVVASTSDLSIFKAAYTFAPFVRERGYLGFTGGLYVARTRLTLSEATLGRAESEDLTAPLPVIGLRGEYEITDSITLRGAGEWFKVDTGDVKGSFRDIYVGVDYGFNDRMAVGLGYNDVVMNLSASESRGFQGALDWGYDGFLLYFRYDFRGRQQ